MASNLRITCILLAALCCVLASATVQQESPRPLRAGDNSWDYMLLVVEWIGSACIGPGVPKTCVVPTNINDFTMHGLWPERNDNTWPSFCDNDDPFDINQVSDLLPQMKIDWYDAYDPVNGTSFWTHEWDKHGTCAKSDPKLADQHAYFKAVLELRSQANIYQNLMSASIEPSNTTSYSMNDIQNAISSGNMQGLAYCVHDDNRDATVLSYVVFCVNTDLEFMPCPAVYVQEHDKQNGCSSANAIIYPPTQ